MKYIDQQKSLKDLQDFEKAKSSFPKEESVSTDQLNEFVEFAFPDRHQLKIDWLRFEQDIRRTLGLNTSYENRLIIIDILLGEHTGRGTQLVQLR